VLVAGLNGDGELLVVSPGMVNSGKNVDVEGGVLDVLALEGNLDGEGSGLLRGVIDGVGTITIVSDMGLDLLLGSTDLHDEGITTIVSGIPS